MISQELSNKIKICSFLATIMVVYRHSFVLSAFSLGNHCSAYLLFVHKMIASITEVAVPFFFLVSGFFFFKRNYYSITEYQKMILKKIKNLFLPFCIWNAVGLTVLFLYDKNSFSNNFIEFICDFFSSNFYGPLWYVRDLMVMMLLIPVYQWITFPTFRWLIMLIVILLLYFWVPVDTYFLSSEGLLFFLLGGMIGTNSCLKIVSCNIPSFWGIGMTLLWGTLSLFFPLWENEIVHKINTLIGVVSFWYMSDVLSKKWRMLVLRLSSFSFFLFVTHFYLVKAIKISIAHFFKGNDWVALCTFLIVPILSVFILVFIAHRFQRSFPRVYSIVTGSR